MRGFHHVSSNSKLGPVFFARFKRHFTCFVRRRWWRQQRPFNGEVVVFLVLRSILRYISILHMASMSLLPTTTTCVRHNINHSAAPKHATVRPTPRRHADALPVRELVAEKDSIVHKVSMKRFYTAYTLVYVQDL